MNLTLYTVSGAPSPWRVAVGLAIKGVPCDVKMLSADNKEHKAEAYLKYNPRGTVPTLVHDDIVLRDSIAILAWLDRTFPENPLFGKSAKEAARIWQTTMEIVDYLPDAASGVLSPIFFNGVSQANDELSQAAKKLRAELLFLETALSGTVFLADEKPSASDAVAFPHVRLIQRAMDTKSQIMGSLGLAKINEHFPGVSAWMERMEALPGVAATFPPHWEVST